MNKYIPRYIYYKDGSRKECSFSEISSLLNKRAHRMRTNPTQAEQAMADILDQLHVRYIFQSPRFSNNCLRIFDFYLPKPFRTCIEVDGLYHKKKFDEIKDAYVYQARPRFKIVRFTNDEVLLNKPFVVNKVKELTTKFYPECYPLFT